MKFDNKLANNLLFSFLVVFFLTGCSKNNVYKIGTYNVRYQNNQDIKNGHSWKERKKHVAATITKYDVDIFGVQEPFENQVKELSSILVDYHRFGVSDDDKSISRTSHHHDIFYKKEKFTLEKKGSFWLSPKAPNSPPKNLFKAAWGGKAKVCTWGKFRDKSTNKIFYVFNTHFYYANKITRNKSAEIVVKKLQEIAKDAPVIFMGDLNIDDLSEAYNILNSSNYLKDTYNIAKQKLPLSKVDYHQTFNEWQITPKNNTHKELRIDYIFVTKHWNDKVNYNAVIWDTYFENGIEKMPSDHNLVLVELELP